MVAMSTTRALLLSLLLMACDAPHSGGTTAPDATLGDTSAPCPEGAIQVNSGACVCALDSEMVDGECVCLDPEAEMYSGTCLRPGGDEDGDGLTNASEDELGTKWWVNDTDGDGVSDGSDGYPLDAARH